MTRSARGRVVGGRSGDTKETRSARGRVAGGKSQGVQEEGWQGDRVLVPAGLLAVRQAITASFWCGTSHEMPAVSLSSYLSFSLYLLALQPCFFSFFPFLLF